MEDKMAKTGDVELNRTQEKVMEYLRAELAKGKKYVSYTVIGLKVGKPRNTVKYAVNRLIRLRLLQIIDGELALVE